MDLLSTAKLLLEKVTLYVKSDSSADAFRLREDIRGTANLISLLVDGPEQAMHTLARQYTVCTALKICTDLEIAAKLHRNEPQALGDLAKITQCDPRILRPVMRVLAQHGVFQQRENGLWEHTPMSEVINDGSFRAWLNSITAEKYQSTAFLPTFLSQTAYAMPSTGKAAYNEVFQTPLEFYTYANEHDHSASINFAVSMRELARTQLPFLGQCYPFESLAPRTRFIDIASGEGNLSFFLAPKLPEATFELQDHETVLHQARAASPDHTSSRVDFRAHNMLLPQPTIDRAIYSQGVVFLLKIVLHDHDEDRCRTILGHVISAMAPEDRLLILETVLPEVGGSLSSSLSDMIILSMFGCGHRTLQEWMTLIHSSGQVDVLKFGGGAAEFDGMMVFEVRRSEDGAAGM